MKALQSGHRSAPWGVFAVVIAAGVVGTTPAHGAWIDPDFRPAYRFNSAILSDNNGATLKHVETIQSDGRMILRIYEYPVDGGPEQDPSWQRLLPDGQPDPSFDPVLEDLIAIHSWSDGRLSGLYNPSDPELVWLDDAGRRTDIVFRFDGDASGRFLPYPGDQHLLLGDFTSVNDVTRHRLARINADGSVDLSFDAGVLDHRSLKVVALSDGRILISGNFDELGGVSVPGLARLNANGTVDTGFVPDGYVGEGSYNHGPVVEDSEGRLLRANRGSIHRSSSEGQDTAVLVQINSSPSDVNGLLPLEDGAFLAWGDFRTIGGTDRASLALINGDGTVDTRFNANAVLATDPERSGLGEGGILRLSDGRLVIAAMGIVLMPDGTADPSFHPEQMDPGSVHAVALQSDGRIVTGGRYTRSGSTVRAGLDRLTPSGQSDPTFDPGQGSSANQIDSIAIGPDDSIWIGGGPTGIHSVRGAVLARHEADGALDPTFALTFDENARVRSVSVDGAGRVVLGGRFTTVGGHVRNGLARLNPDHSLDTEFGAGIALTGQEVEVFHVEVLANGDILIAGTFDAWRGERRWGLLKLDAEGELKADFVPNEALAGLRITAAAGHPDGSVGVAALNGETRPRSTIHLLDALGQEITSMPSAVTGYADVPAAAALPGGMTVFSVVPRSDGYLDANSRYNPFLLTLNPDGSRVRGLMPETDEKAIKAMTSLPDGGLLVAGDFSGLDGMVFDGLARISSPSESPMPRMANISTRGLVSGGDRDLIAGFVIEGTEPQRVMIRGVGPTLRDYGIASAQTNPVLSVVSSPVGLPVFSGGFWWIGDRYGVQPDSRILDMSERLGAFPLTAEISGSVWSGWGDGDAAVILDLFPGAYTVQLSGQESGIGLIEVYSAAGVEADRRITNLSTRGWVGVDEDRLLGGFVIDGGPKQVLIRAIGPALGDFGVTDHVEDPHLWIVRTNTLEEVASNDNWMDGGSGVAIIETSRIVGAFPLQPGSNDAALLLELEPDAYTAIVSGVDRSSGVGLVEVYELP